MTGSPARIEGTLTSWDDDRGFGFLTPVSGRGRAFVHITAFSRGSARPRVGDAFSYEVDRHGDRGPAAVRVAPVGGRWSAPRARAPRPTRDGRVALVVGLVLAVAIVVAVGVLATTGARATALDDAVPWLIGGALVLSLTTAVVYAVDKSAARHGRRRVPERVLLLLGLFGGWPGALVAQQLLRHKTSKRSFQVAFWATVAVDVLAVAAALVLVR